MAVYQCKMCGGNLDIVEGSTICECGYCGTKQTVPTIDDDKKVSLFTRANHLRLNCDFDKAENVYESIAAEFPQEPEAYWGLCLCKYGIEYVDDPVTGRKIPTCHRTSTGCIFDDENFEQANEYADPESRDIYYSEAKEIDRIQKGILEIVKNEEPYDVFICYKETDANGDRTKDSVMAQDIYNALIREGYKVFFSRITLEDKLGQQYEPYIFAALTSARVMLVVGTHREHFNAVWVKNEWSRFLDMMKTDRNKLLIPCYADIDAYDMPREFKNLQGQDMNKIGFIQDLIRGIGKIIPKGDKTAAVAAAPAGNSVPPLLERMFMFLSSGDFDSADAYCERILDLDPKCGKAYLGKLLVQYHCCDETMLDVVDDDITESPYYDDALKYGCDIREYGTCTMYNRASKLLGSSSGLKELSDAKGYFEKINGFKDSAEKLQICTDKLSKAKAVTEDCRNVLRSYDNEKEGVPNAEPLNRVITAQKTIKTKWPKFNGTELPAPFSPAKLNVWFIPLGIGLIAFAVCMIKYLHGADNTEWYALGALFVSFFAASVANCIVRKFFSLGYFFGIMIALNFAYTLVFGGYVGGMIDNTVVQIPGDMSKKIPVILILVGAAMLAVSVILIVVYCRRMGEIHGYFKALDNLEKLKEQMNASRDKEINDVIANCPDFNESLISDCVNTARETY